jgi:hypothetical protein
MVTFVMYSTLLHASGHAHMSFGNKFHSIDFVFNCRPHQAYTCSMLSRSTWRARVDRHDIPHMDLAIWRII